MPSDNPVTRLRAVVHITEDFTFDLNGIYETIGESADLVRDALVKAINTMRANQWDRSLVEPYGKLGTTFAFNFCSGYIFSFKIETQFNQEKPIEEHYYLKNLFRKN